MHAVFILTGLLGCGDDEPVEAPEAAAQSAPAADEATPSQTTVASAAAAQPVAHPRLFRNLHESGRLAHASAVISLN